MASSVFDMQCLQDNWSTAELRRIFSEQARYEKWLMFEAALAAAQAELGMVPQAAAVEIGEHCRIENLDPAAIAQEVRRIKHPLVPVLRHIQAQCSGTSGEWLHFGATTQDVVDTGTVLQLKDAHTVFVRDIARVQAELNRLALEHRDTPMVGRTHGIQALPITFGHKCAIWSDEMRRHAQRFERSGEAVLTGMVAGAVGSQASMGELAKAVEDGTLKRLGLNSPLISWAPARDRFTEYALNIAMLGATLSKIANELFNMQRNEIAEVEEIFSEGKVGSSTMPHKRNPVLSENIAGLSRTLRANASLMLEGMVQEGERDGISWKVEYKALPECCMILGAMLAQSIMLLGGLRVDRQAMGRNIGLLKGYLLSERVMLEVGRRVGKQTAHEWVYEASMAGLEQGLDFSTALRAHPRLSQALTPEQIEELTDPSHYLGACGAAVDRVLASQNQ